MKKSIKEKAKVLETREKQLRLEMENSEEKLRKKAKSAGKLALIGGIAALLIYWIYKSLSEESTKVEEEMKIRKKKHSPLVKRLSNAITPYAVTFFSELLDLKQEDKD